MTEHFMLPDRLDSSAGPVLFAALNERIGRPLVLDAAAVEVVGTLAIELLISAGHQWAADGHELTVIHPSKRFSAACALLGLQSDAPWQPVGSGAGLAGGAVL